jgi:cytochrome c-type biogenesis protein CcmH
MLKKIFFILIFAAGLSLVILSPVLAQDKVVSDDEVNAIAREIYCPVCENIPLDVCPTQICSQWRELIREQLSQGMSEAEIKTYFVNMYGDRVLATPPTSNRLSWLLYILPPLSFVVGAVILFRTMRAWKRPIEQVATEIPPADDEYVRKLEEELRSR